ncbi:MAG TPA: hypothetical protein VLB51_14050 [Methylomirabilota bacterium]|nr:hypothetical protein [Methylomirabilota bacterium]
MGTRRDLGHALGVVGVVVALVGVTAALIGPPAAAENPTRIPGDRVAAESGGGRTPCGGPIGSFLCGEVITGSTFNAPAIMDAYSCIPNWDESGPEIVWELPLPQGGPWQVVAELTYATVDLDLFVLGPTCDSSACIAAGDSTLSFQASSGDQLYLVVDGYQGAAGDFGLRVTCQDLGTQQVGIFVDGSAQPGAGGNLPSHVYLWNNSSSPVTATVTGDLNGLTYLYDSSPFPVITSTAGVTWQVGSLAADAAVDWVVFTSVDGGVGSTVLSAFAAYPGGLASIVTATVEVADSDPALFAAPAWQGPAPGAGLPWLAEVCNLGSTASGDVVLTMLLTPLGTSSPARWWSNRAGWIPIEQNPSELALRVGSVANQDCAILALGTELDPNLPPNFQICAELQVIANGDTNPGNNTFLGCVATGNTLFADGFELGEPALWWPVVP